MLGITFRGASGLGDKLQFSSFPENYFRNAGEKVIDVDRSWIFDHNPYVERDKVPDRMIDLWTQPWPLQKSVTQKEYAGSAGQPFHWRRQRTQLNRGLLSADLQKVKSDGVEDRG